MKTSDHGYFAALTYDLRVRERLVAAGVVAQSDIERYLTELPELEAQAEGLGVPQPALVTAAASPPPAPIASPAPAVTDGSGSPGEAGAT